MKNEFETAVNAAYSIADWGNKCKNGDRHQLTRLLKIVRSFFLNHYVKEEEKENADRILRVIQTAWIELTKYSKKEVNENE